MFKVLVVDDEKRVRTTLTLLLAGKGYDVREARDVDEALGILSADATCDVVVTDINMPGATGLELVNRIHESTPDTQVIVMTGAPTVDTAAEAVRGGACDYLTKPVNKEAILHAVGRATRIKGLLDDKRELEKANRVYQANLEHLVDQRTREVAAREERLKSILAAAPVGIAIACNGMVLEANQALCDMVGCRKDEMLGRSLREFFSLEFSRACEDEGEGWAIARETTWGTRDGRKLHVLLRAAPLGDGTGGIVVAALDVTQNHSLQEQFFHAQKMEAVGRLAGGVAHDFNNLLSVILGFGELMQVNGYDRSHLDEVIKAGEQAAVLTRQLLAFSRKEHAEPRVIALGPLIEGLRHMLERLIGENIRVKIEGCEGSWLIRADPVLMEQVILNLAVNARDAMPRGGSLEIRLSAAREGETPEIERAGEARSFVVVSVRDTGCGIDAAVLGRVFEAFFSTKPKGKGTGLGLSTVHAIVTGAGGHVLVSSEVGVGTTFRILLPLQAGAAADPQATPDVLPTCRGERVLVVEDDRGMRTLVEILLSHAGYRVVATDSAKEALRRLEEGPGPIDLLLTDVVMPESSGPELAQEARKRRPGLPTLFMSGYTDDVIHLQGLTALHARLLRKPFTQSSLLLAVHQALSEKN